MLKNILLILVLVNFSEISQGGINFLSSWNNLTANARCQEIISQEMRNEILQEFLYPNPDKLLVEFSVIGLLTRHLASHHNTDVALDEDIQEYTQWLHAPFGLKNIETVHAKDNFRMTPKTSFYFYISLLSLMRDMHDTSVKEFPFSSKKPFYLKEAVIWWAINNKKMVGGKSTPDEETIYPEILAHRSEYFELLAYRFFEKNKRLDGWGKFYTGKAPENKDERRLGTHQDNWKSVQLELEDYRLRLGGNSFAANIGILTKAQKEVEELKPVNYSSGSSSSEDLSHFEDNEYDPFLKLKED